MSRDYNNGFDEWGGYMEAKITKLEEQFSAASDPFRKTNIFAGISIYVNGHTNPSADELKRIMMVHGGTYHHYERAHTTYIIASNLPDVKVRNMNNSKTISPQWVVDCVREQRILDYSKYLLYTNQRRTQPSLNSLLKRKNEETQSDSNCSTKVEELKLRTSLQHGSLKIKPDDAKENKREVDVKIISNTSASASSSSVARTAVDPKFLPEFYNNSRLHHIATLGAGFKQYVNELRQKHGNAGFPRRAELREKLLARGLVNSSYERGTYVMHIDMDCFFVSVGLRKYPQLRGKPVAVTHSKGGSKATNVPSHPEADRQAEMELFATRFEQHLHNNVLSDKVRQGFDGKMSLSEIASCSYEARAKGIRNGMFVGQALQLCPDLKTIPYDFEGYREVAFTLYDTIAQYTLNIEAVSCDEMFVDLSELLEDLKVLPMAFVEVVREEVRQKTGCPCSAGVGANKLQARMATKRAKPDGQYELLHRDVGTYMANIPIGDLPGVGSSTTHTLQQLNLITCGDLQKTSLMKLKQHVGKKLAETLHQFCRGIDTRPLVYGQIRKSVSAEVNYGIRFSEYTELEAFLRQLCAEVHKRLTDIQRKTKCITLKLMLRAQDAPQEASKFMGHGVCDYLTKSVSLSSFTDELELITRTVLTTMKALALPPNELRGIGIQLTKLDAQDELERKENIIKNMFSKIAEKQQHKEKPSNCDFEEETTISDIPTNSTNDKFRPEPKESEPEKPVLKRSRRRPAATSVANSRKDSKKPSSNNDILKMLKNAAAKKTQSLDPPIAVLQCPPDADPTVFAELPNDIRAEIWRDYERRIKAATSETNLGDNQTATTELNNIFQLNESDLQPSTSKAAQERLDRKHRPASPEKHKIDEEFLQALPPDIRAEIETQIRAEQMNAFSSTHDLNQISSRPPDVLFADANEAAEENLSVDNLFAQGACYDLLLQWVETYDEPGKLDVHLVCIHAREFVRNKFIDKLYDPLMYLCRLINSHRSDTSADCMWHAAYREIIEAVQLEMRGVYEGRKLFLGIELNCDKCSF